MEALNAEILSTRISTEDLEVAEEACEATSSLRVAASLKAASIEAETSTQSHDWDSSLSMKLPRQVIRDVASSDQSGTQGTRLFAVYQPREDPE
jgi:hypothetical protein